MNVLQAVSGNLGEAASLVSRTCHLMGFSNATFSDPFLPASLLGSASQGIGQRIHHGGIITQIYAAPQEFWSERKFHRL